MVQVRWDFDSCGIQGMYGPTQEQCDEHYLETNLHNNVRVNFGVQSCIVPADGLYLVTAVLKANFHLMQGEIIDIIVGQRSDYKLWSITCNGAKVRGDHRYRIATWSKSMKI